MLLFLISMLAIVLSSYMIAGCLNREKNIFGLIYMFIISFANIVLTFEILSLFSAISRGGVLLLNLITFIISFIIWRKNSSPIWSVNCRPVIKKIYLAVCKDKYLMVLGCAYLFLIFVTLSMTVILPAVNPDGSIYHILRSVFWISNHNLNHFDIGDYRALCMPINSEILYSWLIIFVRKIIGLGFFEFFGYVLSIICIWKFFDYLKISTRPRLWTIFILAAFPAVIVQMSGSETDMIIAGLISSSILMYWYSIKEEKIRKIPLFMSALSYAIAIGTKTPSIVAIPAVGIFMLYLSIYYRRKDFYKPFLIFLGYGILNFIVFSSYNYILNFIDFGDIRGNSVLITHTKIKIGIGNFFANLIKHTFLLIDFTGFRWAEYFGEKIIAFRDGIITFLNLPDIENVFFDRDEGINQSLLEPLMGLGVCGILALIPAWIISIFAPLLRKDNKTKFLFMFGFMYLMTFISISILLVFMPYSIRFIMSFTVMSAPILVYTYSKKNNIYKFIVSFFAVYYLIFVSAHLWSRPILRVINYIKYGHSISSIREVSYCSRFMQNPMLKSNIIENDCQLRDITLNNFSKQDKILYFPNGEENLLAFSMLKLQGYQIDFRLLENFSDINFSVYDVIIIKNGTQYSNVLDKFENGKTPLFLLTLENKDKIPPYDNGCLYCGINFSNNPYDAKPVYVRCRLSKDLLEKYGFKFSKQVNVLLDGLTTMPEGNGAWLIYTKK
ncbi:hypothetical protein J6E39_03795 [bacterium]|nr:hypothetical protein [bacterium]